MLLLLVNLEENIAARMYVQELRNPSKEVVSINKLSIAVKEY
jgi:hypothetical protein